MRRERKGPTVNLPIPKDAQKLAVLNLSVSRSLSFPLSLSSDLQPFLFLYFSHPPCPRVLKAAMQPAACRYSQPVFTEAWQVSRGKKDVLDTALSSLPHSLIGPAGRDRSVQVITADFSLPCTNHGSI